MSGTAAAAAGGASFLFDGRVGLGDMLTPWQEGTVRLGPQFFWSVEFLTVATLATTITGGHS